MENKPANRMPIQMFALKTHRKALRCAHCARIEKKLKTLIVGGGSIGFWPLTNRKNPPFATEPSKLDSCACLLYTSILFCSIPFCSDHK